ncbi:MAG: alpha-ketoacid dehydrogenase subunit beta [Chloroflexota bacterium]|nr:MAG: alpha-ketoacid dehydrogenase subunit beta [Chloroflexota bacterium]
MPVMTLLEAVREALQEEMREDPRVIVLGEDVGAKGGVFKSTEGLQKEFGEERVIDTPLAESLIVGAAIGASINGLRPVAEIQFADFIHSAIDQIVSEAARLRYRSNGMFNCPIVIRAPFGGGVHGALYHSQSLEALFYHVPGLKIVAPSTPYDAKGLLKAAIRDDDPVLFFEHKKAYRLIKGEVPQTDYVLPIGKAEIRRRGDDITLISYGLMLHHSLEAAEALSKEGIEIEVIDLRTIAPLDMETILASVKHTGKVMIVNEDNKTGGIGAEIAASIVEVAFEDLDGPIVRVAGPDIPAVPFSPPLEEFFLPNPTKIAEAARQLAEY